MSVLVFMHKVEDHVNVPVAISFLCSLTICARRYICAWVGVRVGLDGLPSRTACWEIVVGVELIF